METLGRPLSQGQGASVNIQEVQDEGSVPIQVVSRVEPGQTRRSAPTNPALDPPIRNATENSGR